MKSENTKAAISRVSRSREQVKKSYDRISRYYDYVAGIFEKKYRDRALGRLGVSEGEKVLEIGFGTGDCLKQIALMAGDTGKAWGIDISSGMLEVSRKKLVKAGLAERVELRRGDAAEMPYMDDTFDAVFCSFTLELFDTPEIPEVLGEISRVLRPQGRFGVLGMSKGEGDTVMIKIYEWFHDRLPNSIDCRPIPIELFVSDAGFEIIQKEKVKLFGLPVEIVIAEKPPAHNTHNRILHGK